MEEIDVLLPTYNGEKFLKEQIDSILAQSFKNIRLLISDDCSKDSTCKILKEYEKQDERIKVFYQEKNLGVVKNIEFLLGKVEAPVFMFADQDDFWQPDKVQKSYDCLYYNESDLAFTDLEVVDENLNQMYPSFNDYMLLTRKINKYIDSTKLNYLYNCVTGCTLIARKSLIKYILPLPSYSKYLIHDHWIGLMASIYGKVDYLPEKTIKYRQHGNNQVGTEKISHGFTNLKDVRKLFIDVKLGVFGTYVQNAEKFPNEMQDLNQKALDYYKDIENKRYFNFKGWSVFHKLYSTEPFMYYMENFLIMNLPLIRKWII